MIPAFGAGSKPTGRHAESFGTLDRRSHCHPTIVVWLSLIVYGDQKCLQLGRGNGPGGGHEEIGLPACTSQTARPNA